jgi:hypothetical protein
MSDLIKNERIELRVSKNEKKLISKKASELNISNSAYILQCVRQNRIVTLNGVKDVVHQLYKIGTNVNQIATKANSINYISKDEIKKTQDLLTSVFKIIDKFIVENNKHIIEELQSNLTTEQKFELLLEKVRNIEFSVGELNGLLQNNCAENKK